MPRKTHPLVALVSPVAEAFEAVRSPRRIMIVRWLHEHPNSQVSDIVDGIGSQRIAVYNDLVALEKIGIVIASLPAGERERQPVTYHADLGRWDELLDRLKAHPHGP